MEKIAILTDSNSGITQKEGKELGINVVPMPFFIDGEEYLEDISLTQEGFYEKLTSGANVSTSQPAIGYINSIWDELLTTYDKVIYIPMSSGLSKSCETALISAQAEYEGKVYVIDNQRISVTQRQSVLDAMEMIKRGYSCEKIVKVLMDTKMNSDIFIEKRSRFRAGVFFCMVSPSKTRTDIFIMVDTLKYLKQGGRITPAAAALGGMLRLKPILLIKGEKLDKFKMRNTSIDKAKDLMIQAAKSCVEGYLKDIDGRTDNVHLAVAYTGTDTTEAMDFVNMIKAEFGVNEVVCEPLSLSVSCHIGPGALAIAVSKAIPDNID